LDPIQASSFAFLATLLPKRKEVDMQQPHSVFLFLALSNSNGAFSACEVEATIVSIA